MMNSIINMVITFILLLFSEIFEFSTAIFLLDTSSIRIFSGNRI